MHATQSQPLDRTFAALAHPARREILARLRQGAASVTELAEPFAMSQPAISKHLRVLEQAGLVERHRAAQSRPCSLRAVPLRDAADWVDDFHHFWDESLVRLDSYLRQLQHEETSDD
ncbi:MAG: ArsR/SmtB family transcription factor [Candidatus Dormibacteria bacterium]